jgi:hypothetical protein
MALVGTTSLMLTPAGWCSAGQPLWAGTGILAALWYAQFYRRSGRMPALVLSAISAVVAGGFWTVGHMAGPASAIYLWADGRRRCRRAAMVPLFATFLAVVLSFVLAARPIDARISFHGRTVREAFNFGRGVRHTAQAIPENLVFANVGLTTQTTTTQGLILTLALLLLWTRRAWRQAIPFEREKRAGSDNSRLSACLSHLGPLEWAGAALVLGSYLVEWSFRGYFEFRFLRTINLRFMVPWYDIIPQIGAVLLAMSWWSRRKAGPAPGLFRGKPIPPTWLGGLCVLALASALVVLNRPRVESLVRASVPDLLPSEREMYPLPRLQTLRADVLLEDRADWQRGYLRRLDRAQEVARRLGVSRDALHSLMGHPWVSGAVRDVPQDLANEYDAIGLLDLPEHGPTTDYVALVQALLAYFIPEPEPRPSWIAPNEPWPPPADSSQPK